MTISKHAKDTLRYMPAVPLLSKNPNAPLIGERSNPISTFTLNLWEWMTWIFRMRRDEKFFTLVERYFPLCAPREMNSLIFINSKLTQNEWKLLINSNIGPDLTPHNFLCIKCSLQNAQLTRRLPNNSIAHLYRTVNKRWSLQIRPCRITISFYLFQYYEQSYRDLQSRRLA